MGIENLGVKVANNYIKDYCQRRLECFKMSPDEIDCPALDVKSVSCPEGIPEGCAMEIARQMVEDDERLKRMKEEEENAKRATEEEMIEAELSAKEFMDKLTPQLRTFIDYREEIIALFGKSAVENFLRVESMLQHYHGNDELRNIVVSMLKDEVSANGKTDI